MSWGLDFRVDVAGLKDIFLASGDPQRAWRVSWLSKVWRVSYRDM